MENIIETINKTLKDILNAFNESELIIVVKSGKIRVIENGKPTKGIQKIELTYSLEEVPILKIEKVVI